MKLRPHFFFFKKEVFRGVKIIIKPTSCVEDARNPISSLQRSRKEKGSHTWKHASCHSPLLGAPASMTATKLKKSGFHNKAFFSKHRRENVSRDMFAIEMITE